MADGCFVTLNSMDDTSLFRPLRTSSLIRFTNTCDLKLSNYEVAIVSYFPHVVDAKLNKVVSGPVLICCDIAELSQYGSTKYPVLRLTDKFPIAEFSAPRYANCLRGNFNTITVTIQPATVESKLTQTPDLLLTLHFRPKQMAVRA